MITKERLEELIQQSATIYYIFEDVVFNTKEIIPITLNDGASFDITNAFETKEEVEFALRFKRIPRTEYLDLPTWEEFCELDKLIVNYEFQFCGNDKVIYLLYFIGHKEISVWNNMECKVEFNKKATKENYIEACEICRKLFLGEEV